MTRPSTSWCRAWRAHPRPSTYEEPRRFGGTGAHNGRAGDHKGRAGDHKGRAGDHKGRPYGLVATAFALLAGCGQVDTDTEQTSGMETARIVSAVRGGLLQPVEQGEHFAIYDVGVKEYPPTTFLVQSSDEPINLGRDMLPYMDTAGLWDFVRTAGVALQADTPSEVYLYNWIEGAQGPMVFDVGVIVEDGTEVDPASGFQIKRYPAMKFSSLIYEGPFPHEPNSGWQQLRWEERAKEKGLVYTERLYRELYHAFDHQTQQHITEVQIEIR